MYKGAYICSCLKDPAKYFGLASDTGIIFGLFNTILDNATLVNFQQVARFIKSSRYWQEYCPPSIKYSKGQIYWPSKEMTFRIGSSELHVLGSNMFAYAMDEANLMEVTADNASKPEEQQAYKIYNNASRRMMSRFLQYGFNPGLAIIASSRVSQSSFLEELMEKNSNNPMFHVSDYALWDVKGRDKYSPKTFRVLRGNENRQSEVLDEMDTSSGNSWTFERIKEKAQPVPAGMDYIEVPADFYFQFQGDVEGALRDIAGLATYGKNPLITRVESVSECIDPNRKHPFLSESHTLPLRDFNADLLRYVRWEIITKVREGVRVPIHYPGAPRFVHVDLALTKCAAGIAMACPYDVSVTTEYDAKTGQVHEKFMPKVWIDFVIRIVATKGDEIDITKVVAFLLNLPHYGFPLHQVTFDGYASEMAIQVIRKASLTPERRASSKYAADKIDINADTLSLDKTDVPYKLLRDLLNQKAISYYKYPWFEREVKKLVHDVKKRKVDHPLNGSKDVADAICGAAFNVCTAKVGVIHGPEEVRGSSADKTIEDETLEGIVQGYPDLGNVTEIIPPPVQEPRPRQLRNNTKDWTKQLEGFGRHRRLR
jgi:hypothetical protein